MLNKKVSLGLVSIILSVSAYASTPTSANKMPNIVESPDATKILDKDWLKPPKTFQMPKDCVSTDKTAIARGEFFFNNLNSDQAKKHKDYAKSIGIDYGKKTKNFGNCVACHNVEKAVGAGNIGPDLTNYREYFVDSKTRTPEWVFQKISDARVDNPQTYMTINQTTGLFNEREICDIVSFLLRK